MMAPKTLFFVFAALLLVTTRVASRNEEDFTEAADVKVPAPPVKPPVVAPTPQVKPPVVAPTPPVKPPGVAPAPPVKPPVVAPAPPVKPPVVAPAPPVKPPVVAPAPPVKPPVVAPAPPVKPPVVAPAPPVKPPVVAPSPPFSPPKPPKTTKDCIPLCIVRCKLHSRKNVCLRACVTCCDRCKCVPPGYSGNYEKCGKCYGSMTTRGGKRKCP